MGQTCRTKTKTKNVNEHGPWEVIMNTPRAVIIELPTLVIVHNTECFPIYILTINNILVNSLIKHIEIL